MDIDNSIPNPFENNLHISFSVSLLSVLTIGPNNSFDLEEWAEKAADQKRFGVKASLNPYWWEGFKKAYKKMHPGHDFDHEFGTILLNAKNDKVMSYGNLVSTYYYNNTIPNLLEVYILLKGKYH